MAYIGNQPTLPNTQSANIADGAVTTPKIAAGAATLAKLDTTGTAGRVLTAQGPGVAPQWVAPATFGNLIGVSLITSGTSVTTPAGCTKMLAEAVGAGGGGSGVSNGASGDVGGGGGSGAYAMKLFTVAASTSYTCVIGTGGAGSTSSTTGTAGTATTLTVAGVTISAGGGAGGIVPSSTSAAAGGSATGGDINVAGMSGSTSTSADGADQLSYGGDSPMGFGTGGMSATLSGRQNGTAGYGFGAGGSGGRNVSGSGTAATGGAGAGGCIRVWFFA